MVPGRRWLPAEPDHGGLRQSDPPGHLINHPPRNIDSTRSILGWADETLKMIKRALRFKLDI
jgi:hypothetical protein